MKFVSSDLMQEQFFVLQSTYKFISPTDPDSSFESVSTLYDIDINYAIKEEKPEFHIFTKVSINRSDNPLPGYVIFAECVTVFKIKNRQKLSVEIIRGLIGTTAVGIAVNNLRNFVSNLTKNGPAGEYLFPLIDLKAMINLKKQEIERIRAKKKPIKAPSKSIK